jgi:hypothetical protein
MGLALSFAGMNRAWSKWVAWGSIVTGLIRLGGEIIEGSRGGRVPGLDCFLRVLWELVPRERFGRVGGCFLLLLREDEDMLDVSYFIVEFSAPGVVGLVNALGSEGTGGGGGREYFGGVEAGR